MAVRCEPDAVYVAVRLEDGFVCGVSGFFESRRAAAAYALAEHWPGFTTAVFQLDIPSRHLPGRVT
ncbi:hypothetical protein [Frankia sp. Cr2]|uniref:hypothetical protein n=1 Tax=Frankia sp. Cr2 TaxID=3073932 RepID=UPI002AD53129|nr:hypothetical protein [Frankia sp. Cr2]